MPKGLCCFKIKVIKTKLLFCHLKLVYMYHYYYGVSRTMHPFATWDQICSLWQSFLFLLCKPWMWPLMSKLRGGGVLEMQRTLSIPVTWSMLQVSMKSRLLIYLWFYSLGVIFVISWFLLGMSNFFASWLSLNFVLFLFCWVLVPFIFRYSLCNQIHSLKFLIFHTIGQLPIWCEQRSHIFLS